MRDAAKREARFSGFPSDWAVYRKLRNHVVKVNRESKRAYFLEAINNSKKDAKSMWKTINNLLGRSSCPIPTYAKQSLSLMNFALAALILQRSGDVALLLNPHIYTVAKEASSLWSSKR